LDSQLHPEDEAQGGKAMCQDWDSVVRVHAWFPCIHGAGPI